MRQVALCSIFQNLFWTGVMQTFASSGGEESSFPHPPRFENLKPFWGQIDFRDPNMDPEIKKKALALFKAMEFSHEDFSTIEENTNSGLWIGAGCQAKTVEGRQLLWKAVKVRPKDPEAHAAFIFSYLNAPDEGKEFLEKTPDFKGIEEVIATLKEAVPENALADYLEAAAAFQGKDDKAGMAALAAASGKGKFDTYRHAMRRHVVEAAEAVGYSKCIARTHAIGQPSGLLIFRTVARNAMAASNSSPRTMEILLELGNRLFNAGHTVLEKMAALRVKETAWYQQDKKMHQNELNDNQNKFDNLNAIADQSQALAKKNILNENDWVCYFDDVFATSEQEAMARLLEAHKEQK